MHLKLSVGFHHRNLRFSMVSTHMVVNSHWLTCMHACMHAQLLRQCSERGHAFRLQVLRTTSCIMSFVTTFDLPSLSRNVHLNQIEVFKNILEKLLSRMVSPQIF
jgi:hypothetical protein